jgi:CRISPR-associated endonuclease/helicase Cas3
MKQARRLLGQGARQPLLLAVKAALIVADSVASGVVRTHGHSDGIKPWIDDVVHCPPLTAAEIEDNILARRIAHLEQTPGLTFKYHAFQDGTAALGPRALVLAACGAGKTLAAWRWAAAQARSRPIGRVIFLYPTRGTATEGFRDYVGWAPEADAALVHGTARYELQAMERNPSEALKGKRLVDEEAARLFALGLWSRRYFSATVDQFLGFLEHSYDSLCLLPALADSAVILDEIHSYDRPLFRALLCFLESFDVPVLCMTATLPPDHREDLLKLGLEVFPAAHHRDELADLEHQEQRKRYVHRALADADAAMDRACAAFKRRPNGSCGSSTPSTAASSSPCACAQGSASTRSSTTAGFACATARAPTSPSSARSRATPPRASPSPPRSAR